MENTRNNNEGAMLVRRAGVINLGETALFLLTLMLWCRRILMTYVRAFLMRLPVIGRMADEIIIVCYVMLIIFALPEIFRKLRLIDIYFGLAVSLVCVFNYALFPRNVEMLNEHLPTFLFYTFPLYFIGLSMDRGKMYPWLYRFSVLTIILFTLYKLFVTAPMTDTQSVYEGDMWSSYNLLPHVSVVALHMLRKPRILNTGATVIGIVMLASLGTRGSLLGVIVVIAIYLLFFKKYRYPRVTRLLIILSALLILLFMDGIMLLLQELSENMGLSVRIFEKYFEGSLSESSSRELIRTLLMQRIKENPVFGHGLYADRTYIGTYAHNIIIELWLDFGVLAGTGIFAAMIAVFLKTMKQLKKAPDEILLLLPLFAAGFLKLFLSVSYLEEIYLFWLIGLCVSFVRESNNQSLKGA